MELKIINSNSLGNCMLLKTEKEDILLDCGVNPKDVTKANDHSSKRIKRGFLTHIHLDHSAFALNWLQKGITVFMPYGNVEDAQGRPIGCKDPYFTRYPNAIEVEANKKYIEPNFRFVPFEVPHDGVPCFGYVIFCEGHRIAWMTDLEYCPYDLSKMGITDLIVECNYVDDEVDKTTAWYKHKMLGHQGLEACKKTVLNACQGNHYINNVILIHASDNLNRERVHSEIQALVPCPVYIAQSGMSIQLRTDGECPF